MQLLCCNRYHIIFKPDKKYIFTLQMDLEFKLGVSTSKGGIVRRSSKKRGEERIKAHDSRELRVPSLKYAGRSGRSVAA